MKILLGIGGFLSAIIIAAALVLLIIAVAKGKIGTDKIKTPAKWLTWVITLAVIGFAGYWVYGYLSKSEPYQQTVAAKPENLQMPVCENSYDFTETAMPAIVEAEFSNTCLTSVKLPFMARFRIEPDKEVKIRFMDGTEAIDGPSPNFQNWAGKGSGKELFKVYGLKEAGTLKISLEKRN